MHMERKYNLLNIIMEGFPEEVKCKQSPVCGEKAVKNKTGTIS